jgi:hypothetical protein
VSDIIIPGTVMRITKKALELWGHNSIVELQARLSVMD